MKHHYNQSTVQAAPAPVSGLGGACKVATMLDEPCPCCGQQDQPDGLERSCHVCDAHTYGFSDVPHLKGSVGKSGDRTRREEGQSRAFAAYFTSWLDTEGRATYGSLTLAGYQGLYRNHFLPALGWKDIAEISPADVEQLCATMLASGLSPSSVLTMLGPLSSMFKYAVLHGHVSDNPVLRARQTVSATFRNARQHRSAGGHETCPVCQGRQ